MKKIPAFLLAVISIVVLLGVLFVYSQTYLAEYVYPRISQLNLCSLSFGTNQAENLFYPNRDRCLEFRAIFQSDWQYCLNKPVETDRESCMAAISKQNKQDFCNRLPDPTAVQRCQQLWGEIDNLKP
jgi:hypothetical protein